MQSLGASENTVEFRAFRVFQEAALRNAGLQWHCFCLGPVGHRLRQQLPAQGPRGSSLPCNDATPHKEAQKKASSEGQHSTAVLCLGSGVRSRLCPFAARRRALQELTQEHSIAQDDRSSSDSLAAKALACLSSGRIRNARPLHCLCVAQASPASSADVVQIRVKRLRVPDLDN